jgi:cytochrome c-type biogenesis protein CcmH
MKWGILWLMLALTNLGASALAVEPGERLADPALEARARAISGELRCLVCQNESIDDSNADLAHDIRMLVRQRLTAGESDAQVVQSVVDRYGPFVLLKPPVEPATYALWFGPPIVLALGLAGSIAWIIQRRRQQTDTLPALSPEERARLDELLRESGG